MGPIQDRPSEHLGSTDVGILITRRLMLRAMRDVQEGRDPPHIVRRPEDNHFPDMVTVGQMLPTDVDPHAFWRTE
jgi:hypothetical protein